MFSGLETMAAYAFLKGDEDKNGRKHVEICKHCGKRFVTDNSREFCSYDCQKSA